MVARGRASTASCRRPPAYGEPLRAAIADGRVDRGDRRPRRRARPAAEVPARACSSGRTSTRRRSPRWTALEAEERTLAAELGRRSIVLLENDGVLPLRRGAGRIAVVGPIADSARDLIGDYATCCTSRRSPSCAHRANPFGFPSSDVIQPDRRRAGGLADDPRRAAGAVRRRTGSPTRAGTGLRDGTRRGDRSRPSRRRARRGRRDRRGRRAIRADRRRDDRRVPRPARPRAARPAAGAARGASSRPARRWCCWSSAAGRWRSMGGRALLRRDPARVGAGRGRARGDRRGPRGRRGSRAAGCRSRCRATSARCPLTYRHHPTGGRSNWKGDYVDGSVAPLWPFGHGRSYTTFSLRDLRRRPRARSTPRAARSSVRVEVTNTGARAGDEVVQLYVRDEEATVARPVIELRGFRRVPPRARRVPHGRVPAVGRAARLHRRRLPAGGRAGPGPDLRGPLVGGPAAVRASSPSPGRRSSSSTAPGTSPRRRTRPPPDPAGVGGPPPRRRPSGRSVAV